MLIALAVEFIYLAGSVICHQMPDRSFFIDGQQLPICARCTGLYLSGITGFAGWLIWKAARGWRRFNVAPRGALRLVILAGLPTAITFASAITGIWDGSNMARALFAVPLGAAAGAVVASVLTKDLR
jgi:uncharacterized membrane protein